MKQTRAVRPGKIIAETPGYTIIQPYQPQKKTLHNTTLVIGMNLHNTK